MHAFNHREDLSERSRRQLLKPGTLPAASESLELS